MRPRGTTTLRYLTASAGVLTLTLALSFACGEDLKDTPNNELDSGENNNTSDSALIGADGPTDSTCPTDVPIDTANCNLPVEYYKPNLHLDACRIAASEHGNRITSWPLAVHARSTDGGRPPPTMSEAKAPPGFNGGRYCANAFNGRPGVQFRITDGFDISALDANTWTSEGAWAIVAVMSYEARPSSGDVVFSRVSSELGAGFPGPALVANYAYPKTLGTLAPLDLSNGIGIQVRSGPKIRDRDGGLATTSEGYAAVTENHVSGNVVIAANRYATVLSIRINGTPIRDIGMPEVLLADGKNEIMRIGHAIGPESAFVGTLSELLFYDGITPIDLNALTATLKAKWGIQ